MVPSPSPAGGRSDLEASLLSLRVVVLALVAGVVVPAGVGVALGRTGSGLPSTAVLAVGLAGLAAPIAGFRLYAGLKARARDGAAPAERWAVLHKATIVSLAVTEGAALLGIVVYLFSAEPLALVGAATHVLLAGAVWPSRPRVDDFVAGPGTHG